MSVLLCVVAAGVDEPAVAESLAMTDPVVSVADAFKFALVVDDLSSVSQAFRVSTAA